MNNHIIHYILERVNEDKSVIRFMNRKGDYREYNYPTLWNDIKKYAAFYKERGVKEGDIVSIILPTCEEYLAAFFAANLMKAIPVSLYPPTSLVDLNGWTANTSQMISSIDCHHLVTNLRISPLCEKLVKTNKLQMMLTENINRSNDLFTLDIEVFNKDDICFLQFSSGTTGIPKAVIISQENALTNARLIIDALPTENENIKTVSWLPLYHDMGLVGCLLMSIVNGSELVLIRPDDFIGRPHLWLKAMHDHKLNCTTAPNFAYGLIQKRVDPKLIASYDLSHVKAMLCGAEVVYKETMTKFIEHMKPSGLDPKTVLPVYGMAETTLAVTFTKKEKGMNFIKVCKKALRKGKIKLDSNGVEICSVGEKLETFDIQIVDENDNSLKDAIVGRVLIKGPCVTQGYFNSPQQTQEMFKESYLDSGDEGFLYEGQLYICGRLKDTMIIRGKNYYPTSIEEKLYNIEGIRKGRAIVSSCYNPKTETEEVVILAEAASYSFLENDRERIIEQIKLVISAENLPLMKAELYSPGILVKTSSGKLKRRENIKLWQSKTILKKQTRSALRRSLQIFKLYSIGLRNRIIVKRSN